MTLVRQGHSWSGSERNRFFLNSVGTFHELSSLSGLDHPDDGRGLAVVDWDQDGRLDLWYRNRTAPRLRLMMNSREADPSLSIRLEATSANRDGIGAVVQLLPKESSPLVRSLRAGDLFLSQSSKWLHFGTKDSLKVTGAEVLWPGGKREQFSGLSKKGRFLLKEGSGKAITWKAKISREESPSPQETQPLAAGQDDGFARIILPSRIPIPAITYRDQVAKPVTLRINGKARLLILWSGECPHCSKELRTLTADAASIRGAQLELFALSVDGLEGPAADLSSTYDLIDESSFPFPWGFIDVTSANQIHRFQKALFDRTPANTVPLALLLDQGGNCVAIYRGPFDTNTILTDWQNIKNADEKQLYHLAPPLTGTWFTNPLPRAEVIPLVRGMMK